MTGTDGGTPDAMVIPPESDCTNGLDDDGDGLIDCGDSDCAADPTCIPEANCADALDNDLDGAVDCADSDCDGVSGCEYAVELTCDDAADNDADGDADCADADCDGVAGCEYGTESTCGDGIDNDGDGNADCADSDCDGVGTCEFGAESTCNDGLDNDADGLVDCADGDCDLVSGCTFGVELACDDAFDNDADGTMDCADSDCDGIGICEYGAEISCGDGLDNDADGAVDCADTNCATAAACVMSCPAGSNAVSYLGTGLPAPIADYTTTNVSTSVSDVGVVTGVALRFSATHTFDADMDITLRSPTGTSVDVSSDNGGASDNYTNTLFIDSAATLITAGSAPFTGSFRPEQAFNTAFAGQPTSGTWTVAVYDDLGGDSGNVTQAQLYLCWCMGTDGCEFGMACRDGVDDDGDGLADCADSDCAAAPNCLPEPICNDGIDNDFDGVVDCLDSDCDGVGTCEFGVEATCNDAIDNDVDGTIDCSDSDCNGIDGCEFGTEVSCADGFDNDDDGVVDCFDSDCLSDPACLAETDCNNGIDDDLDTLVDCLDPGCNGIEGCEFSIELSCDDGYDNDADGATDCADTDCNGTAICIIPTCPANTSKYLFTAADTPLTISTSTGVTSTIVVGTAGLVADAAVRLNIAHTNDADVDVTLTAASGTTRDLTSDNGSTGDNYTNTDLVDSAATAVTAGTAPFSGAYRPEQPFSALAGTRLDGSWALRVVDDLSSYTGTLNGYTLLLCGCEAASGECELGAACNDGVDNDGDGAVDCSDPNCTADPRCLPEGNCVNAIDDDFDGLADCRDSDCNGISACEFGTEVTCDDTFDNDGDAMADCFDSDCVGMPACLLPETACNDAFDNDADGAADCADTDCYGIAGCEIEPNGTLATANDFAAIAIGNTVRARINPAAEVDYFMIVVPPGANQLLVIDTFDAGGVTCTVGPDTYLHLRDSSDVDIVTDDDSGPSTCSHIQYLAAPGTYYVRARAFSSSATFLYTLHITMTPVVCGDGVLAASEQCDDGNTMDGDGCSSTCLLEPISETEPNDDGAVSVSSGNSGNDFSAAAANGPYSSDVMISAAITPAGDEDYFAITNTGASAVLVHFETFGASGFGTCPTGVDTYMRIKDAAGTSLAFDDDTGVGACSMLNYSIPAGTTVYAGVWEYFDDATISSYYLWVNFP